MSAKRKRAGGTASAPEVTVTPDTSGPAGHRPDAAAPAGGGRLTAPTLPAPRERHLPQPARSPAPADDALVAAARSRAAGVPQGEAAAVCDDQGRIWAGTEIALPALRLSPVRTAVVAALAGGAAQLTSAVVISDSAVADVDLVVLRELGGPGLPLRVLGRTAS